MYYYMNISLYFENPQVNHISPIYFKENITRCVRNIFGDSASCEEIDLLKYIPGSLSAIIRVPKHLYVKVHASLTLCGSYHGQPCSYVVHKVSPLLLSVTHDSRDYKH